MSRLKHTEEELTWQRISPAKKILRTASIHASTECGAVESRAVKRSETAHIRRSAQVSSARPASAGVPGYGSPQGSNRKRPPLHTANPLLSASIASAHGPADQEGGSPARPGSAQNPKMRPLFGSERNENFGALSGVQRPPSPTKVRYHTPVKSSFLDNLIQQVSNEPILAQLRQEYPAGAARARTDSNLARLEMSQQIPWSRSSPSKSQRRPASATGPLSRSARVGSGGIHPGDMDNSGGCLYSSTGRTLSGGSSSRTARPASAHPASRAHSPAVRPLSGTSQSSRSVSGTSQSPRPASGSSSRQPSRPTSRPPSGCPAARSSSMPPLKGLDEEASVSEGASLAASPTVPPRPPSARGAWTNYGMHGSYSHGSAASRPGSARPGSARRRLVDVGGSPQEPHAKKRYARPTSAIYSLRDMPVNESMESLLTTRKDLNMAKLEESAVAINGMLNQSIKENKTIKAQLETQINKQIEVNKANHRGSYACSSNGALSDDEVLRGESGDEHGDEEGEFSVVYSIKTGFKQRGDARRPTPRRGLRFGAAFEISDSDDEELAVARAAAAAAAPPPKPFPDVDPELMEPLSPRQGPSIVHNWRGKFKTEPWVKFARLWMTKALAASSARQVADDNPPLVITKPPKEPEPSFHLGVEEIERRICEMDDDRHPQQQHYYHQPFDAEGLVVRLSHLPLRKQELLCLGQVLRRHLNICRLVLADSSLDDEAMRVLVGILQKQPTIDHLDLSDNQHIAAGGAAWLGTLLEQSASNHKRVTADLAQAAALDVMQGVKQSSAAALKGRLRPLASLALANTGAGDRGATLLAHALPLNVHLQHLDLRAADIGNQGAVSLGQSLMENGSLVSLCLGWNRIGPKGAKAIAEGAADNPRLEVLDLSHNALGDLGGCYIGELIKRNERLQHFDLTGNNMKDQACLAIADGLNQNQTLATLKVCDNPLGYAGARYLVDALVVNNTLQRLNLQGCSFHTALAGPVLINREDPGGEYDLELSHPAQRLVAQELLQLRAGVGPKSWKQPTLNGKRLARKDVDQLAEELPLRGSLHVTVDAPQMRLTEDMMSTDVAENIFSRVIIELEEEDALDEWRLSILHIIAQRSFFPTDQLECLLATFRWPRQRAEAVVLMYGSLTNPQDLFQILATLAPADRKRVVRAIGSFAFFNPINLTGTYTFDLSKHVDRSIAGRLLAATLKEGFWREDQLRGVNWRNASLNKVPFLRETLYNMDAFVLPDTGALELDYVTVFPEAVKTRPAPKRARRERKAAAVPEASSARALEAARRGAGGRRVVLSEEPPEEAGRAPRQRRRSLMEMMSEATSAAEKMAMRAHGQLQTKQGVQSRSSFKWRSGFAKKSHKEVLDAAELRDVLREIRYIIEQSDIDAQAEGEAEEEEEEDGSKRAAPSATPLEDEARDRSERGESAQGTQSSKRGSLRGRRAAGKNGDPRGKQSSLEDVGEEQGAAGGEEQGARKSAPKKKPAAKPNSKRTNMHKDKAVVKKAQVMERARAVSELLRVKAVTHYIKTEQLCQILLKIGDIGLDGGKDARFRGRVDAFVTYYERVVDRGNFSDVLRLLPAEEQVATQRKLGYLNLLDLVRPYGIRYCLNLNEPEEKEVCSRLVKVARRIRNPQQRCFHDLKINGKPYFVAEDQKMMTTLLIAAGATGDEATQALVDFKFVASDIMMMNGAALFVQSQWRRKRMADEFKQIKNAVGVIKKAWRQRRVRQAVNKAAYLEFLRKQGVHIDLSRSIFSTRELIADSHDFFNSEAVFSACIAADFSKISRVLVQAIVHKMVPVGEPLSNEEASKELKAVKQAVLKNQKLLYTVFRYFSAHSTSNEENSAFCMDLSGFKQFVKDAEISANKSKFCQLDDLVDVFMTTGIGYFTLDIPPHNPDHMLTRPHFLELIVRLAICKFCKGQTTTSVAQAVYLLCEVNVFANLSVEPALGLSQRLVDVDMFRKMHLYNDLMHDVFSKHRRFLSVCYDTLFKTKGKRGRAVPSSSIPRSAAGLSPATGEMSPGAAQTVPHKEPALALANGRLIKEEHRALCTRRTRGQRMTLQHWIRLLTFVNMNRPNTGVGEVMRTFIFRRSQMEVVQDGLSPGTFVMGYVDFLEALAHFANLLCPPTDSQLAQYLGVKQGDKLGESSMWKFYSMVSTEEASQLRDDPATRDRPLGHKVKAMLNVVIYEMQKRFSCETEDQLCEYIELARTTPQV